MFWGCLSYQGPGPILPVTGTMNSAKYIETLTHQLFPQMNVWFGEGGGMMQQDNAPCHKDRQVKQKIQDAGVQVLKWPPYSPDLAPTENLWAIMKNKSPQK